MTSKTYIRLIILCTILITGAVLFSASSGKHVPAGEENTQCREKNCDTKVQSDNTAIWESISRHLLGANQ